MSTPCLAARGELLTALRALICHPHDVQCDQVVLGLRSRLITGAGTAPKVAARARNPAIASCAGEKLRRDLITAWDLLDYRCPIPVPTASGAPVARKRRAAPTISQAVRGTGACPAPRAVAGVGRVAVGRRLPPVPTTYCGMHDSIANGAVVAEVVAERSPVGSGLGGRTCPAPRILVTLS